MTSASGRASAARGLDGRGGEVAVGEDHGVGVGRARLGRVLAETALEVLMHLVRVGLRLVERRLDPETARRVARGPHPLLAKDGAALELEGDATARVQKDEVGLQLAGALGGPEVERVQNNPSLRQLLAQAPEEVGLAAEALALVDGLGDAARHASPL